MIPHKVLNIRCYICTYLALFFIFVFIRLLEYQILQFHLFYIIFNPKTEYTLCLFNKNLFYEESLF